MITPEVIGRRRASRIRRWVNGGLSNAGPDRPGTHPRRLVVARLALFRMVSRDTPDVTQCGGPLG